MTTACPSSSTLSPAGSVDGARQKDEYLKIEVDTIAQLVKRYKSTAGSRGGQVDPVAAKGAAYAGFDVIEDAAAYARFKDECEAIRSKRRFVSPPSSLRRPRTDHSLCSSLAVLQDGEILQLWLKKFSKTQQLEIRLRRRKEYV